MPTPPRSSTYAHSAAMRRTTSSAVNIAAIVATLTRSLASAGTLDANGNRVFNLTQFNLVNGATLDIQGGASDFVVLNYGISGDFKPNGTIELTGGITEDHVLFNIDAGQTLNAAPIRRLYREYS
jgi:hypothetical protein